MATWLSKCHPWLLTLVARRWVSRSSLSYSQSTHIYIMVHGSQLHSFIAEAANGFTVGLEARYGR
jgi:hypothetical protein